MFPQWQQDFMTLWSLQVHWVTWSLLTLQFDQTTFCQTSLFHRWLPKETTQLVRQLLQSLATNLVPHKVKSPRHNLYNSDPHRWFVFACVTVLVISHTLLWMSNFTLETKFLLESNMPHKSTTELNISTIPLFLHGHPPLFISYTAGV